MPFIPDVHVSACPGDQYVDPAKRRFGFAGRACDQRIFRHINLVKERRWRADGRSQTATLAPERQHQRGHRRANPACAVGDDGRTVCQIISSPIMSTGRDMTVGALGPRRSSLVPHRRGGHEGEVGQRWCIRFTRHSDAPTMWRQAARQPRNAPAPWQRRCADIRSIWPCVPTARTTRPSTVRQQGLSQDD